MYCSHDIIVDRSTYSIAPPKLLWKLIWVIFSQMSINCYF